MLKTNYLWFENNPLKINSMITILGKTIFKKFASLVLAFLILFASHSFLYAQGPFNKNGKSCLWQISFQHNMIYLLGSVHILKKKCYPLNESMEKAFDNAHACVFEINLDNA